MCCVCIEVRRHLKQCWTYLDVSVILDRLDSTQMFLHLGSLVADTRLIAPQTNPCRAYVFGMHTETVRSDTLFPMLFQAEGSVSHVVG